MYDFVALDLDSDFCNFNFCSLWDPTLRLGSGPSESSLYKLAYLARKGDLSAAGEYADTLDWTLREESFECFQRAHGPRPIRYEHWFYAKLQHLLEIFLYDELCVHGLGANGSAGKPRTDRPWEEGSGVLTGTSAVIQPFELEQAFSPRECETFDWMILLRRLLLARDKRMTEFERILDERISEREGSGGSSVETHVKPKRRRRTRNAERDSIIASCLNRGDDRRDICRTLDKKGIETTKQMREHNVNRWTEAWDDPEFRNNVQQLFAKVKARHEPVKS